MLSAGMFSGTYNPFNIDMGVLVKDTPLGKLIQDLSDAISHFFKDVCINISLLYVFNTKELHSGLRIWILFSTTCCSPS